MLAKHIVHRFAGNADAPSSCLRARGLICQRCAEFHALRPLFIAILGLTWFQQKHAHLRACIVRAFSGIFGCLFRGRFGDVFSGIEDFQESLIVHELLDIHAFEQLLDVLVGGQFADDFADLHSVLCGRWRGWLLCHDRSNETGDG